MVKMNSYEQSRVAVDAVILRYFEGKLEIYLNRRAKIPFEGSLELPGGLLLPGETAESTLQRKVSLLVPEFPKATTTQFFTFTNPSRDPRARTITIGYLALLLSSAARNEHWHTLPVKSTFAFDHKKIIETGLQYLASHDISQLAPLLPCRFRLNDLHSLAELIFKTSYDNRNFRRRVITLGIVEETDELDRSGSHRPARLYQFVKGVAR
jgi:8-oxo-dGTP diphosphatase